METESTAKKLTPDATLQQIISVDSSANQLLHSIGLDPNGCEIKTLRQVCLEKQ